MKMVSNRTNYQVIGLKISMSNGKRLAKKHPEIADYYRNGKTLIGIAKGYPETDYKKSKSVGINSIRYALLELMTEEEVLEIGRQHMSKNGVKSGIKTGLVNGNKLYNERRGIFSFTKEEKSEIGRKAISKRGFIPFDLTKLELPFGYLDETECVSVLKQRNLSWKQIVGYVSKYWGHSRTRGTLKNSFHRKKSK